MIILREIKQEDADLMLEWVRDPSTRKGLLPDMLTLSEVEIRNFCKNAKNAVLLKNPPNIHFAVEYFEGPKALNTGNSFEGHSLPDKFRLSKNIPSPKQDKPFLSGGQTAYNTPIPIGEYLGTVSLKNIDYASLNCEYSIVLRSLARGTGIACKATDLILDKAFNRLGMHKAYLRVLSSNKRAVSFYEKYGFCFEGEFKDHIYFDGSYHSLKWYSIIKCAGRLPH